MSKIGHLIEGYQKYNRVKNITGTHTHRQRRIQRLITSLFGSQVGLGSRMHLMKECLYEKQQLFVFFSVGHQKVQSTDKIKLSKDYSQVLCPRDFFSMIVCKASKNK